MRALESFLEAEEGARGLAWMAGHIDDGDRWLPFLAGLEPYAVVSDWRDIPRLGRSGWKAAKGKVRMEPGSFGLVWTKVYDKPDYIPYRLAAAARWLAEGGILVADLVAVKPADWDKRCGAVRSWIVRHLEDARVFPDGPAFYYQDRVVLVGRKVPVKRGVLKTEMPLGECDMRWRVPKVSGPFAFEPLLIDSRQAEEAARRLNPWEKKSDVRPMIKTPLPQRKGHLALLMAGGELDGPVGSGDARHIVKGMAKKVSDEVRVGDRTVVTDRYQISISVLRPDGEFLEL